MSQGCHCQGIHWGKLKTNQGREKFGSLIFSQGNLEKKMKKVKEKSRNFKIRP